MCEPSDLAKQSAILFVKDEEKGRRMILKNFFFVGRYAKRPFTTVQITLTQKKVFEPFAIGIYVARTGDNAQSRLLVLGPENLVAKTSFEKTPSVSTTVVLEDTETPYDAEKMECFVFISCKNIRYAIIPATFYQNQCCKFSLQVRVLGVKGAKEGVVIRASTVLNLLPCEKEKADFFGMFVVICLCLFFSGTFLWNQRSLKSAWTAAESGGCRNHATWLHNPQVSLKLGQDSKVGFWFFFFFFFFFFPFFSVSQSF
jgi:hypothetical protein